MSTINQYWNWLENSFVSNIRAQQWYNGKSPQYLSGFINDKSNRLIGWATIRQLRIKSNLCPSQKISTYCYEDYSLFNEEKYSFQPGWSNQTTQIYNSAINQAFQYQSSAELDTYVYVGDHGSYDGGGYVYEFRGRLIDLQSNLSELHQLGWIDNQTRAVIIQLTLYNPNSQLFTSVTLLTEFLSTGGLISQSRFEPIAFAGMLVSSNFEKIFVFNLEFTSIFQLVCVILYIGLIVYFMFNEIQCLFNLKLDYFQQFWSYIEVGIIVCSWASLGAYVCRYKEAKRIGDLFEKTNGYYYINLQFAVYVNDILTFFLGFCCFFGTIKFLRLCRFNQRLSLFSQTLKYATKELVSFTCMFLIVFLAFITLFYLSFVSKMSTCANLLDTSQMLFEMILLKFDASELIQADVILGPLYFSLFIFFVVFVCMSMFFTIINNNFRRARENVNDNQEILSFMWNKFQRWTGF
jgi:polycystin 2